MANEHEERPLVQLSLAGLRLRRSERLTKGRPGDFLSDEELTEIAETDCSTVGGSGRGIALRACKAIEIEHDVVWVRVAGAGGIRCIDPTGIVDLAGKDRKRINRVSRRAARRIGTVKQEDCKGTEWRDNLTYRALMGALNAMSSSGVQKTLEAQNLNKTPDVRGLLEAFKSAK